MAERCVYIDQLMKNDKFSNPIPIQLHGSVPCESFFLDFPHLGSM